MKANLVGCFIGRHKAWTIASAVLLLCTAAADAQQLSGARRWVVYKLSLSFADNSRTDVADFDQETDAKAYMSRLNRNEPLGSNWTFQMRKRQNDADRPATWDFQPFPSRPPRLPAPKMQNPFAGPATAAGFETLAGFGDLTFRFQPNGQVQMIDAKETSNGTWTLNGQTIRLVFYNGQVVYTGQVNGGQLSGTAANGRVRWTWRVNLR